MEGIGSSSSSSWHSTGRLLPKFQNSTKTDEKKSHCEYLFGQRKTESTSRNSIRNVREKSYNTCRKANYSRFLQQNIPGPQTEQKMETSNRSQYVEPKPYCTDLQDGDGRNDSKLASKRGMDMLSGYPRRILPYTDSSKSSKIPTLSNAARNLSIRCSAVRNRYSAVRVYLNRQGGKTVSKVERGKDSPVSRRLADSGRLKRAVSRRFKNTDNTDSTIGMADKF